MVVVGTLNVQLLDGGDVSKCGTVTLLTVHPGVTTKPAGGGQPFRKSSIE